MKNSILNYNKDSDNIIFNFLENKKDVLKINFDNYDIIHVISDEYNTNFCNKYMKNISNKVIIGPNVHIENLKNNIRKNCFFFLFQKWILYHWEQRFPKEINWMLLKASVNYNYWKPIPEKKYLIDFLIPGKGYNKKNFDSMSKQLIEYGESKGLICKYLPSFKQEEYLRFLQQSKFVVFPSSSEIISNSNLECLSTNVPIVLYDHSKEFFDDCMGYKCNEYSLEEFKKGIDYMIENFQSYNPREYIIENYNEKQAYEHYINALKLFYNIKA